DSTRLMFAILAQSARRDRWPQNKDLFRPVLRMIGIINACEGEGIIGAIEQRNEAFGLERGEYTVNHQLFSTLLPVPPRNTALDHRDYEGAASGATPYRPSSRGCSRSGEPSRLEVTLAILNGGCY